MKISVFGLGYVGVVTSVCFAAEGHEVIGVDVAPKKVDLLNEGISPIVEERIGDLLDECVKSGRLRATLSVSEAIASSDLCIVCVGTPSSADGALELGYVAKVISEIAEELQSREDTFTVVVRSTIVPGTMENLVVPTLCEKLGDGFGEKVKVLFHPEFLREGSSVYDFYNPPKIVIGERNQGDSELLLSLYPEKFDAPRIVCEVAVAEMVKYCDNLYHALKVTFANEVGIFAHAHGIDSAQVMDIFCQDTKLNISSKYMRPGFAFGGSCLPKDLRAFLAVANQRGLSLPMLSSVIPSNVGQIERVLQLILDNDFSSVGFYGLAFKAGTDDLRESPYVELAERLLGKGKLLSVYDPNVQIARLTGKNKSVIDQKFPHLASCLVDTADVLVQNDLVILCHNAEETFVRNLLDQGKQVVDLTGGFSQSEMPGITPVV